jgi:hypothetical protein
MVAQTEGDVAELKRLVLDYRSGELVARVLDRSSLDAPNPGTVRRRRQVEDLTREGLRQALASLEGRVDLVGTSGYQVREDIVLCTAKGVAQLDEHKGMKRGA